MPSSKIIYDNVHGNIRFTPIEIQIIDTSIFQRLRRIRHLGLAETVYPGATHSRFAHSIGTLYTISEMLNSLQQLGGHADPLFPEADIPVIRLVGLLHDLGHLPLSHVFEELLEEETGKKHEYLTVKYIQESEIGRILDRFPDVDQELLRNILEKNFTPTADRQVNYVSLIDGNLDADKLDYLKRDSIHTGVGYGSIDVERILRTISVDDKQSLCILQKGQYALENLCIARFHMYQTVYLHKSVIAFETMLKRLYKYLMDDGESFVHPFTEVVEFDEREFIKYNDAYIWHKLYDYSGPDEYIRELIEMFIKHQSVKLVRDDPRLVDPDTRPERKLTKLNYQSHKEKILERFPDFDLKWLFTEDSRSKLRKSDYEESPIKVKISDDEGVRYDDIADLEYSIMNLLKKEFINYQIFTHSDYVDRLREVIREPGFFD